MVVRTTCVFASLSRVLHLFLLACHCPVSVPALCLPSFFLRMKMRALTRARHCFCQTGRRMACLIRSLSPHYSARVIWCLRQNSSQNSPLLCRALPVGLSLQMTSCSDCCSVCCVNDWHVLPPSGIEVGVAGRGMEMRHLVLGAVAVA